VGGAVNDAESAGVSVGRISRRFHECCSSSHQLPCVHGHACLPTG
jgi:hypothetical protein